MSVSFAFRKFQIRLSPCCISKRNYPSSAKIPEKNGFLMYRAVDISSFKKCDYIVLQHESTFGIEGAESAGTKNAFLYCYWDVSGYKSGKQLHILQYGKQRALEALDCLPCITCEAVCHLWVVFSQQQHLCSQTQTGQRQGQSLLTTRNGKIKGKPVWLRSTWQEN